MFAAYRQGLAQPVTSLAYYQRGIQVGAQSQYSFPLPHTGIDFSQVYYDMLKYYSRERGFDTAQSLGMSKTDQKKFGLLATESIPRTTLQDVQIIFVFWGAAIEALGVGYSQFGGPIDPEAYVKDILRKGGSLDDVYPHNAPFWGGIDKLQRELFLHRKRTAELSYTQEFKKMFAKRVQQIHSAGKTVVKVVKEAGKTVVKVVKKAGSWIKENIKLIIMIVLGAVGIWFVVTLVK